MTVAPSAFAPTTKIYSPCLPPPWLLQQIVAEKRYKRGVPRNRNGDPLVEPEFVSYKRMRLVFYLHEPPTKTMFKVVGPLFLVLILMLVSQNGIESWLPNALPHRQ